MNDRACPFCAIAAGHAPAEVVYEDEETIAFLPHRLDTYGHTLIVPRVHRETFLEMDAPLLCAVMRTAQRLTDRYAHRIGATGVNLLHASGRDAQQSVLHFHLHLLPRFPHDGLDVWPHLTPLDVDRAALAARLRA